MAEPPRGDLSRLGLRTGGALGVLALLKLGLPAGHEDRSSVTLPRATVRPAVPKGGLRGSGRIESRESNTMGWDHRHAGAAAGLFLVVGSRLNWNPSSARGSRVHSRVTLKQQWQVTEAGPEVQPKPSTLDLKGNFRMYGDVKSADVQQMSDQEDEEVPPPLNSDDAHVEKLCTKGLWKRALRLLAEMWEKGIVPSSTTYAAAISACADAHQYHAAMSLLEQAKERGVPWDVAMYTAGISACAANREWRHALSMLREMKAAGVEPTAATYHGVIMACQQGSQWQRAVQLLQEMQQNGLVPELDTFNAVIRVCARQQQWEQVEELVQEMGNAFPSPDARTYEHAIHAARSGERWAEILRLLDDARRRGTLPQRATTYTFALEACTELQSSEKAFEILAMMKEEGIEVSDFAYDAAIRACEKDGQLEAVKNLEEEKARQSAAGASALTHRQPRSRAKTNLDWGL